MFEHQLVDDARAAKARIVLPEGAEPRILEAARQVRERGIAELVLLGDRSAIEQANRRVGLDLGEVTVIDPANSPLRLAFAQEYARLRAHKGVTVEMAADAVVDPSYFGTLMVHGGHADGMVSGSITTTAATVRPALEVVRTAPGVSIVSSVFLMCLADRVLVYGDCAINPDPNADQLADIAISSAQTAAQFGIEPRVAMLSYSTGGSGSGADVEKVREATALVRERAPELLIEGPIQYDAAVDPHVAATKLRTARSPAGPRCSSSPTSTRAATPTKPCSAAPARSPSGRCFRAWASRSTTCRGGPGPGHRQHHCHHGRPGRCPMTSLVLVINAGSSSLKFQLIDVSSRATLVKGLIERVTDHGAALTEALRRIGADGHDLDGLVAVGHRVVHGGASFSDPAVITAEVRAEVERLVPLAPLHNPAGLLGIDAALAAFPDVPHVAVFDTAFHQSMPPAAHVCRARRVA